LWKVASFFLFFERVGGRNPQPGAGFGGVHGDRTLPSTLLRAGPFDFLLGFARSFGKTGQALSDAFDFGSWSCLWPGLKKTNFTGVGMTRVGTGCGLSRRCTCRDAAERWSEAEEEVEGVWDIAHCPA